MISYEAAVGKDRVVQRLQRRNIVTDQHVRVAYNDWIESRRKDIRVPLWRFLTVNSEVSSEDVYVEAAKVYAFKEAEFDDVEAAQFINSIEERFTDDDWNSMVERFVLPIGVQSFGPKSDKRWTFVTHDPTRPEVHQLIQNLKLRRFELRYAREQRVVALVSDTFLGRNEYLQRLDELSPAMDMGTSYEEDGELVDEEALEAEISRSHLINLFEAALVDGVKRGASDIHIYPNSDGQIDITFRIDGELQPWHTEDRVRPESFLAVVKDNSTNVDRFERDTAQDGFIQRRIDDTLIRFRVSILPIASAREEIHAESIVIRILDDRKVLTDLRQIGLLENAYERFQEAIRQPHGMVILTGPTGSGKSTTLVASLHQVITPKVNVLTVEDPVEYIMKGVRQIKLGPRLGLEGALRAILRHDPDIVMVGEMRDRQTAELAIKLANTGHLTFSTLHTNDAPSAVSRLYKMGIEPFLIAYAINIVVAQRLVRNLCPECKTEDTDPKLDFLEHLGFEKKDFKEATLFRANEGGSCKVCKGSGYKGRRAIAETMLFTDKIRAIIMKADDLVDEDTLRAAAIEDGMTTLPDAARTLVLRGETSVEEIIRVTGA